MGSKVFAYPKPLSLVRSPYPGRNGAGRTSMMDSFAGTGTTGHAVIDLNRGRRRTAAFLLVEMESGICEEITHERLKKAVEGYSFDKPKGGEARVEGLGGGLPLLPVGPRAVRCERQHCTAKCRLPTWRPMCLLLKRAALLPKQAAARCPYSACIKGERLIALQRRAWRAGGRPAATC